MSSDLPEGWREIAIGDCLEDFRNGWTYDTRATDGSMPITRIETISNGIIDYNRVGFAQPDDRLDAFRLRRNDILFSHINSVEHIAKVAIKEDDRLLYHGMNLIRLRPNELVDPGFLFARLQSNEARTHFRSVCKKAVNQASLNKGEIGGYRFAMPSLEEQRRIAKVLRSVDAVLQAHEKEREQADRILKAACSNAIPDPTIDPLPSSWQATTIGQFSRVSTGKTPSTKSPEYWNGDIPFVTPTDLNDKIAAPHPARSLTLIGAKQSTIAPAHSVLYTCIASVGKIGITDKPVAFNQQINACACSDVDDAAFLYWALSRMTASIRDRCGMTAVPIINKSAFSELPLFVPPKEDRRQIANALSNIALHVEQANRVSRQIECLKSKLLSELLSGHVRVPA